MRARAGRRAWSRRVRIATVFLLLLGTTACGARWDEEQTQAVLAREHTAAAGSGAVAAAAESSAGAPSGESAPTAPPAADATSGATLAPGASPAGDGGGPAAPASGGGAAAAAPQAASGGGALPCAAPSDAPGVTDGEITVGNIATLSGPIPGLGEGGAAATRAYVAFRNATGGVCGRSIKLLSGDDGQDNSRYRSIVNDFNSKVFAIVGGLAGGDAGGIEIVKDTGIPVVSVPVSLDFHHVPTVFGVNPPYADPNQPTGKYHYLVQQGATKVALVYPGIDQTRAEVNAKHRPQMEASGMKIVLTEEFPLGTLNYDSVARAVANSGADYMLFVSEVGADASMAKSMANTGYHLKFADYLTGYSPKFIDLAGDAAEGSTAWIRVLPNEEAGGNAEQNRFLDWMDKAAPGIAPDVFAADSWAAAKAFFDTLETLPGPISRASFVDTIRKVKKFDAGGFLGPIQLGPNVTNGCVIGMIVDGGKWRRMAPATGFLC